MDALAGKYKFKFKPSVSLDGLVAQVTMDRSECSLLMPTTFMNNSGTAVGRLVAKKGFKPQDILVVCDDLALPFGQVRIKPNGSAGGHNGLKSLIEHLASKDFARLRMGIGQPPAGVETVDHVLANFTSAEKKNLPDFINHGLLCVECWATKGIEEAMNQFNKKRKVNE